MDKDCVIAWIIAPIVAILLLVAIIAAAISPPFLMFRLGYLSVLAMGIGVAFRRYRNWESMQRFDEILLVLGMACLTADIVGVY